MTYFYIFILSLFLTYLFKVLAPIINLVDYPNNRKIHTGLIPLVGGPVILLVLLISILFFDYDKFILLIIYSSIIVFISGFLDDIYNLRIISRLLLQFLSASILIGSGFIIRDVGFFELTNNKFLFLSIIFTGISIIGLTNSINFIDGLDGLCSSVFIISSLFLLIALLFNGASYEELKILILLITVVSAFLLMNINVFFLGRVFLGDSGSISLGFLLSGLLIYFSNYSLTKIDPEIVMWCVTLPIFDFFTVTIKRLISKKNPFTPDKTHIHHLLLKNNFNQFEVLLILVLVSLLLNCSGFFIYYYFGSILSYIIFFLLFVIYYFINYNINN